MATAEERVAAMADGYEERLKSQRAMIDTMQSKLLRIDKIAKDGIATIEEHGESIFDPKAALTAVRAIIREARPE